MIINCSCQHCGVNIEFEAENANLFATCPSCGNQTRLRLDSKESKPVKVDEKFSWKKEWPKIPAAILLVSIIGYYVWEARPTGADLLQTAGEAGVWAVGAIVGAVIFFLVAIITRAKIWLLVSSLLLFACGVLIFMFGLVGCLMQKQTGFEMIGGALLAGVGLLVYIGQRILKVLANRK